MGFRETTNYFGGNCAPQLTPLVDKTIGTAFLTVKHVADNMDFVQYLSNNMESVQYLTDNMKALIGLVNRVTVLEDLVSSLMTAVFSTQPSSLRAVFLWQLKQALTSTGQLHIVDAAIPAELTDIIHILWNNGGVVLTRVEDTLSNFVKTTLGLTDDQMKTLYSTAAAMTF